MGWWAEKTRTLATRLLDILGIEPYHEQSQAPYRVSNECHRCLAHLLGQDGSGSRLLLCDSNGRLSVVAVGSDGNPLMQSAFTGLFTSLLNISYGALNSWPGDVLGVAGIRETKVPDQTVVLAEAGSGAEYDLGYTGVWLVEMQLGFDGTDDYASVGAESGPGYFDLYKYQVSKGQIVYWVQAERRVFLLSSSYDAVAFMKAWDISV